MWTEAVQRAVIKSVGVYCLSSVYLKLGLYMVTDCERKKLCHRKIVLWAHATQFMFYLSGYESKT